MAAGHVLRIVHAARSGGFAGVERSMVLSARALADRGHHVTVIGGDPATMPALLHNLPIPWFRATTTPGVARALWRFGRADVVHADMTAAESAAVATRSRNGGHFVVTRHFAQRRGRTPMGRVAALVIDRVPHTEIAISQYVAGMVGVPSLVVHHGIDDRDRVEACGKRVVVIQRLEVEKRTDLALRAWARSHLGDEGWELIIAGDGADRPALELLARAEGVVGSVRFLGRVDDVDGVRADAAFQLATPPNEHFGLSVLEAMSVGLPVLAADGGAHRELLGDDYAAMFPVGDVDRAAVDIRRLALDPRLRHELGLRLWRRQRARFSLVAHGEALEAVYRRTLEGLSNPSPSTRQVMPSLDRDG